MKSELTIGKVLKPRGLKGELKFELYSDDASRFEHLKSVRLNGVDYAIEKINLEGIFGYIKFCGVDSVEAAELLRNKAMSVDRADLPKLPANKHYISDIIGLDVLVGGSVIGEIVDVLQYGSADVYVVKATDDASISFPAIKDVIKSVDIQGGIITLDDRIFPRVAVYN